MIAPAHPLPTALDPGVLSRGRGRRAGQLHTRAGNAAYLPMAGEASGPGTGRRAAPGPARHPQPINEKARRWQAIRAEEEITMSDSTALLATEQAAA